MNLSLRPYQPSDAVAITSWLKSEYLMRQWCTDRYEHYSVTPEDMNAYHARYIDGQHSRALTMMDDNDIVGYFTLRTPADNPTEQRLGFVIVDDSKRGCGLGKTLVAMAVKYAFETLGAKKVSLGVFENNPFAIHCYEAAGFQRVSKTEKESYSCLGETWDCIEMNIMCKDLKDMTLEELWELFPIVLTSHNPRWLEWAREEITELLALLEDYNPIINHIGSTAMPDIQAKPIIDILVEVSTCLEWMPIRTLMENNGYICMSYSERRVSFNKGYAPKGYADKVFHVHFHRIGDNDEILFRNCLIDNPQIAKEYEKLKQSLLPTYRNNRDGYTEAKTEFVRRVIDLVKHKDL